MAGAARILGELAEDDIDWLLLAGDARAMPAGAVLIEEGAPVGALFIVLDGLLSVAGAAANGRRAEQRGSGDILGEMSFVDGRPPSATVTALEDSTVFAVPAHSLRTKLQLDAGFSARFHRAVAVFLADRLRGTSGAPGAPARLAAASALGGNVHLAQGRFDRLVSRLSGDRPIVLTGNDLTIETVIRVAEQRDAVDVSATARDRVARSRAIIERLAASDDPVYGLNTGLGALKHLRVDA